MKSNTGYFIPQNQMVNHPRQINGSTYRPVLQQQVPGNVFIPGSIPMFVTVPVQQHVSGLTVIPPYPFPQTSYRAPVPPPVATPFSPSANPSGTKNNDPNVKVKQRSRAIPIVDPKSKTEILKDVQQPQPQQQKEQPQEQQTQQKQPPQESPEQQPQLRKSAPDFVPTSHKSNTIAVKSPENDDSTKQPKDENNNVIENTKVIVSSNIQEKQKNSGLLNVVDVNPITEGIRQIPTNLEQQLNLEDDDPNNELIDSNKPDFPASDQESIPPLPSSCPEETSFKHRIQIPINYPPPNFPGPSRGGSGYNPQYIARNNGPKRFDKPYPSQPFDNKSYPKFDKNYINKHQGGSYPKANNFHHNYYQNKQYNNQGTYPHDNNRGPRNNNHDLDYNNNNWKPKHMHHPQHHQPYHLQHQRNLQYPQNQRNLQYPQQQQLNQSPPPQQTLPQQPDQKPAQQQQPSITILKKTQPVQCEKTDQETTAHPIRDIIQNSLHSDNDKTMELKDLSFGIDMNNNEINEDVCTTGESGVVFTTTLAESTAENSTEKSNSALNRRYSIHELNCLRKSALVLKEPPKIMDELLNKNLDPAVWRSLFEETSGNHNHSQNSQKSANNSKKMNNSRYDNQNHVSLTRSKSNDKHCIKMTLSTKDSVKLNEAENAWKPSHMQDRSDMTDEEIELERVMKNFRSLLNKLTEENFDHMIKEIADKKKYMIDTVPKLSAIVELLFEKSIAEPGYASVYAKLCKQLSDVHVFDVEFESKKAKMTNPWKVYLIARCQEEFERSQKDDIIFKELQDQIKNETDTEKIEDLEGIYFKLRQRANGTIRFIGELYKLSMITPNIMKSCVEILLRSVTEENIERLCKMLTTIGEKFDNDLRAESSNSTVMNRYMKDLENLKNSPVITTLRIKFDIMNVIDLRNANWKERKNARSAETCPKKLRQLQEEEEKKSRLQQAQLNEYQERQHNNQRKMGYNNNNSGMGGRGRHHNNMPDNDGFRTSTTRNFDFNKINILKKNTESEMTLGPPQNLYKHFSRPVTQTSLPTTVSNPFANLPTDCDDPEELIHRTRSGTSTKTNRKDYKSKNDKNNSGRSNVNSRKNRSLTPEKRETVAEDLNFFIDLTFIEQETKKLLMNKMQELYKSKISLNILLKDIQNLKITKNVLGSVLVDLYDKKSDERMMLVEYLTIMSKNKLFVESDKIEALKLSLKSVPSILCDVPHAYDYFVEYCINFIQAKQLTMNDVRHICRNEEKVLDIVMVKVTELLNADNRTEKTSERLAKGIEIKTSSSSSNCTSSPSSSTNTNRTCSPEPIENFSENFFMINLTETEEKDKDLMMTKMQQLYQGKITLEMLIVDLKKIQISQSILGCMFVDLYDKKSDERGVLVEILTNISKTGLITDCDRIEAFRLALKSTPSCVCDVPYAFDYFIEYCTSFIRSNQLKMEDVKLICQSHPNLVDKLKAKLSSDEQLSKSDSEDCKKTKSSAEIHHSTPESRLAKTKTVRSLEGLMDKIHFSFQKKLKNNYLEEIFKLIDKENCQEVQNFIKDLTKTLLKTCFSPKGHKSAKKIVDLPKLFPIWSRCIDGDITLQMECAEAIFEFSLVNSNQKLCTLFDLFYENDIISADAFKQWKECPNMSQKKRDAIKSSSSFFLKLDENDISDDFNCTSSTTKE